MRQYRDATDEWKLRRDRRIKPDKLHYLGWAAAFVVAWLIVQNAASGVAWLLTR